MVTSKKKIQFSMPAKYKIKISLFLLADTNSLSKFCWTISLQSDLFSNFTNKLLMQQREHFNIIKYYLNIIATKQSYHPNSWHRPDNLSHQTSGHIDIGCPLPNRRPCWAAVTVRCLHPMAAVAALGRVLHLPSPAKKKYSNQNPDFSKNVNGNSSNG